MRLTPAFYCQLTALLMPLAAGKLAVMLEVGYTEKNRKMLSE
jgi:acetoin utilization deacetylase AcuC-like enzyme